VSSNLVKAARITGTCRGVMVSFSASVISSSAIRSRGRPLTGQSRISSGTRHGG